MYRYTLSISNCTLIPAGTYATYVLPGFLACPAGEISLIQGSTKCTTCVAGTHSNEEHTYCSECESMTWSTSGSATCKACLGGGLACNSTDGGTISGCDPGSGLIGSGSGSQCLKCGPGWYSAGYQNICAKCTNIGASSCSSIDGTVIACLSSYTLVSGLCVIIQCLAGSYLTDSGSKLCAIGSYSEFSNSPSCTLCSPGTYNSMPGLSTCINCPERYWSSSGADNCTACLGGGQACDPTTGKTTGGW